MKSKNCIHCAGERIAELEAHVERKNVMIDAQGTRIAELEAENATLSGLVAKLVEGGKDLGIEIGGLIDKANSLTIYNAQMCVSCHVIHNRHACPNCKCERSI